MTTPERIKRCLRRNQIAKLREEIKRLKAGQVNHDDMRVMVQIFKGCIETRTLPRQDGQCHEIIKRLLKKP